MASSIDLITLITLVRGLALAVSVAAPACGKATTMSNETAVSPGAAGKVPAVELGEAFAPRAFAAGRFAVAVQRTLHGTHALQVLGEDSTSSLVLELGSEGTATACRGWQYLFRNDGPEVQTEDRYREQQGYRGRYTVVDGVAEVELKLDGQVCPPIFEGALSLARASTLKLRCVMAQPSQPLGGQLSTAPVLLCQSLGGPAPELEPYQAAPLTPEGWFVLGTGHGLRISVTGRPSGAQEGEAQRVSARAAEAPLEAGVWEHPF